ncbi:hypothetical protein ACFQX7_30955 [Luedemannella flava]
MPGRWPPAATWAQLLRLRGDGLELTDADFYRHGGLQGGVAYTPEALRWIFADLTEVELRRMRDEPADSPRFGEQVLWTALFRHDG